MFVDKHWQYIKIIRWPTSTSCLTVIFRSSAGDGLIDAAVVEKNENEREDRNREDNAAVSLGIIVQRNPRFLSEWASTGKSRGSREPKGIFTS